MPMLALGLRSIACTASPSAASGARLKLIVTAGNCSWCAIDERRGGVLEAGDGAQRHLRAGSTDAGARGQSSVAAIDAGRRSSTRSDRWYCGIASRITRYWLAWP